MHSVQVLQRPQHLKKDAGFSCEKETKYLQTTEVTERKFKDLFCIDGMRKRIMPSRLLSSTKQQAFSSRGFCHLLLERESRAHLSTRGLKFEVLYYTKNFKGRKIIQHGDSLRFTIVVGDEKDTESISPEPEDGNARACLLGPGMSNAGWIATIVKCHSNGYVHVTNFRRSRWYQIPPAPGYAVLRLARVPIGYSRVHMLSCLELFNA